MISNMYKISTVENMRKSDAWTIANKVPSKELMWRAGTGVYNSLKEWEDPVAIVCGCGNNAGDGYVIALKLQENNIPCDIILLKEKFSDDGKYYFDQCVEKKIPVICNPDYNKYKTLVDCMLGTGFKGDVRGDIADAIKAINKAHAYVVSVDINSGLNGDTGESSLCVKSDLTVSIGGFKPGHFLGIADSVIKEKLNIDIGIEPLDKPFLLVSDEEYKHLSKEDFDNNIIIKDVNEIKYAITQA
ncbi:MAG: NAD(P)H-hydrate epimerase [Coriobacteriia bacterium]|nr:NAD(P)H-hydrate epimerase [Coriobacteriia bacterium]